MEHTTKTTIDAAGRLVIPKAIRVEAGFEPDMRLRVRCRHGVVEIEPEPRDVHVELRGRICVAVPLQPAEGLDNETVQAVTRSVRDRSV